INGSGIYSGLDERLTQPRWRLGGGWSAAGATLRAAVLWGDRAPLTVRFDQGLYDTAHLRSGRAVGLVLDASWALTGGWRAGASIETLAVGRSADAPLTRGGSVVGSVAQPRWQRDRVALTLQYSR
ncbi:MAG TPA: hypothetical protein VJ598_04480, partial [Albitalea sp.]|nr:hypothetical protein [Albitalea sp.]